MNATTRRSRRLCGNADELRAKDREYQRRLRAKRHAAGLTCNGTTPVRGLYASVHKAHPTDCCCYDCLFPSTAGEYRPTVYRAAVAS